MITPLVREKLSVLREYVSSLFSPLGYEINDDDDLLLTAFVHKSYAMDFVYEVFHNERLEFVGDAIVSAVVVSQFYRDYPDKQEDELTLYKVSLVREETLSELAHDRGLSSYIILGKGEQQSGGMQKKRILADMVEALFGYVAISYGYACAQAMILHYLYPRFSLLSIRPLKSYKSQIQEYIQKHYKQLPTYVDTEYEKDAYGMVQLYQSQIYRDDVLLGVGYGTNKKLAQEQSAKQAIEKYLDSPS